MDNVYSLEMQKIIYGLSYREPGDDDDVGNYRLTLLDKIMPDRVRAEIAELTDEEVATLMDGENRESGEMVGEDGKEICVDEQTDAFLEIVWVVITGG